MNGKDIDGNGLIAVRAFIEWARNLGAIQVAVGDIFVRFPSKEAKPLSPGKPQPTAEQIHVRAEREKKKAVQRVKDEQEIAYWSSYPTRGGRNAS